MHTPRRNLPNPSTLSTKLSTLNRLRKPSMWSRFQDVSKNVRSKTELTHVTVAPYEKAFGSLGACDGREGWKDVQGGFARKYGWFGGGPVGLRLSRSGSGGVGRVRMRVEIFWRRLCAFFGCILAFFVVGWSRPLVCLRHHFFAKVACLVAWKVEREYVTGVTTCFPLRRQKKTSACQPSLASFAHHLDYPQIKLQQLISPLPYPSQSTVQYISFPSSSRRLQCRKRC